MSWISDTEYFNYLKDKRVAIVGPAKSAEGARGGEKIDSYDLVVRVKSTFVSEDRQHDLGTKLNILYTDDATTNDVRPNDEVTKEGLDKQTINNGKTNILPTAFEYICSAYPQEEWFFDRFEGSLKYLSGFNKVRLMTAEPYFKAKKETNRPNAGFSAIIDLLNTPLAELYITGLDFYRSLYRGAYLNSLWQKETVNKMLWQHDGTDPKTGKPCGHDPDAQFKYFKYNMYLKDKRIKVDNFLKEVLENPLYEKYENIL